MRLTSWDPFTDMDRLFNRMWSVMPAGLPRLAPGSNGDNRVEWSPSANISETEREYLIRAELPAVKKEDVKVTLEGGMITIQGERKQQQEEKEEKYHRVESIYGSFTRSFMLPDDVDAESVRCEDRDGVLTVHIPKVRAGRREPKLIRVE
ncbi:MAG: Hsp20/alpha crystallin family protein [Gammaproteobacteria bacterium]|nr:Hsp20/alpha crystallin family protein [Gammaproteobacteria bacterium]